MRTPSFIVAALCAAALCTACASSRPAAIRGQPADESAPGPVLRVEGELERAPAPVDPFALTYVLSTEGLALFEEERAEAAALVAAWAEKEGIRFVPVERAREVFARARSGKHAETGEACGRALSVFSARERWFPGLGAEGTLTAIVSCRRDSDACRLVVEARDRLDWDGEVVLERIAPFDREKPWREALPLALAALEAPSEGDGMGGLSGGIFGTAGGVVEAKPERLHLSVRKARATDTLEAGATKDGLTFPKGMAPLRACFEEEGTGGDLLLEVDGRGRVARCESRAANDEQTRCVCAAVLEHARAKPSLRSRRLYAGFDFRPADVVTPADGLVTASINTHIDVHRNRHGNQRWRPDVSDPSIAEWRGPEDALERCFLDVTEPGERGGIVTLRFDAKGRATSVDVEPDKRGLSEEQRVCVARVLKRAEAPCPAMEGATARGRVRVTVRRLGEPLSSPFGPAKKKDDASE